MTDEAFEYIVDTYREYCGIVESFGCKIGPENHWGWDRVPEYIKKSGKRSITLLTGICIISVISLTTRKKVKRMLFYAMHTHIHANAILTAKEVIRKLALSGYQGTYGVEHHSVNMK